MERRGFLSKILLGVSGLILAPAVFLTRHQTFQEEFDAILKANDYRINGMEFDAKGQDFLIKGAEVVSCKFDNCKSVGIGPFAVVCKNYFAFKSLSDANGLFLT
jgi:hypothetical protein